MFRYKVSEFNNIHMQIVSLSRLNAENVKWNNVINIEAAIHEMSLSFLSWSCVTKSRIWWKEWQQLYLMVRFFYYQKSFLNDHRLYFLLRIHKVELSGMQKSLHRTFPHSKTFFNNFMEYSQQSFGRTASSSFLPICANLSLSSEWRRNAAMKKCSSLQYEVFIITVWSVHHYSIPFLLLQARWHSSCVTW